MRRRAFSTAYPPAMSAPASFTLLQSSGASTTQPTQSVGNMGMMARIVQGQECKTCKGAR